MKVQCEAQMIPGTMVQAAVSKEEDSTYSSLSEVPGTLNEKHAVEDERFSGAAMFGLAASDAGVRALLEAGPDVIHGTLPCAALMHSPITYLQLGMA